MLKWIRGAAEFRIEYQNIGVKDFNMDFDFEEGFIFYNFNKVYESKDTIDTLVKLALALRSNAKEIKYASSMV